MGENVIGYYLVANGTIIHVGITNDPSRRLAQHAERLHLGGQFTLYVVTPLLTRAAALEWENERRRWDAPTEGYRPWRRWQQIDGARVRSVRL